MLRGMAQAPDMLHHRTNILRNRYGVGCTRVCVCSKAFPQTKTDVSILACVESSSVTGFTSCWERAAPPTRCARNVGPEQFRLRTIGSMHGHGFPVGDR